MFWLVLGLIVFLGVHSVRIVAPAWRARIIKYHGMQTWKPAYAAIALVGFVLLIWGYGQARLEPTVLYVPPVWTRHLSAVLMLPVFVLLASVYLPGTIQQKARHPMLVAVKLWALAHLLANGNLADVLLFGGFLVWAVADRVSVKRREQDSVLESHSHPLVNPRNDWIALGIGLTLYGVTVFWGHAFLIGVRPFS